MYNKCTFVCRKITSILNKTLIFVIAALILTNRSLYSKSFVEKTERMEIDWGRLKVKFYGKAGPDTKDTEIESFAEVEKKAWNEGLLTIRDLISDYHAKHYISLKVDKDIAVENGNTAGDRVASSTYSYHNQYFADGAVVVYLENSLAKALRRDDLALKSKETQEIGQFSGLVIRAKKKVQPKANYILVDETGRILFKVTDVALEAYKKSLMGRWFINPTREELISAVGSKPVSLEMDIKEDGVFIVPGNSWNEATQDSKTILSQARIAFALPE